MQRLHPPPTQRVDDAALREAYLTPSSQEWPRDTWVRVNFVMSLDGAITAPDGRSGALGTDVDRRVFLVARDMSDVILVGAGTVRAEDYRASRRPLAIVTRSLDLSPQLRVFADRGPEHVRPMIMTTAHAARTAPDWLRDQAEVLTCGDHMVDLATVLKHLSSRDLPRILCEGGPALLADLLELDLVDEILLTLAPRLVGGDSHLVTIPGGVHPALRFRTTQVMEQAGTVLMRLQRSPGPGDPPVAEPPLSG